MAAVGVVVGCGCGLEEALELLPLAFLSFDLVPKEGDLTGQLAVGIVGFIGFGLGIADPALDYRLVDGIGFSGLLRHQAHPDKQPFNRSEHRISFRYFLGSSSSSRIFLWRMNSNWELSWVSSAAPTTVAPCFLMESNK